MQALLRAAEASKSEHARREAEIQLQLQATKRELECTKHSSDQYLKLIGQIRALLSQDLPGLGKAKA